MSQKMLSFNPHLPVLLFDVVFPLTPLRNSPFISKSYQGCCFQLSAQAYFARVFFNTDV